VTVQMLGLTGRWFKRLALVMVTSLTF